MAIENDIGKSASHAACLKCAAELTELQAQNEALKQKLKTVEEDLQAITATAAELGMKIEARPALSGFALTNVRAVHAETKLKAIAAELAEIRKWWDSGKAPPEELATARALAFEEACGVRELNREDSQHERCAQAQIRALALLPASLVAVTPCHICGSVDPVWSDRAGICSRGHFSDPAHLPGSLVAVNPDKLVDAFHLAWSEGRSGRAHHTADFQPLFELLGLPTVQDCQPSFRAVPVETLELLRGPVQCLHEGPIKRQCLAALSALLKAQP